MYPEHRLRIIAYLVEIGKQLNDLSEDDPSVVDQGKLLHLMEIRDSLTSALKTSALTTGALKTSELKAGAEHRPELTPAGSALEVER